MVASEASHYHGGVLSGTAHGLFPLVTGRINQLPPWDDVNRRRVLTERFFSIYVRRLLHRGRPAACATSSGSPPGHLLLCSQLQTNTAVETLQNPGVRYAVGSARSVAKLPAGNQKLATARIHQLLPAAGSDAFLVQPPRRRQEARKLAVDRARFAQHRSTPRQHGLAVFVKT